MNCTHFLSDIFYKKIRLKLNYINVYANNHTAFGYVIKLSFLCSPQEHAYLTSRLSNLKCHNIVSTKYNRELCFSIEVDMSFIDSRCTIYDKIINDVMTEFFPKLSEAIDEFDFDSEVTNLLATEYN